MAFSDFLSLLGAYQMWSIWYYMPFKVLGDFFESQQHQKERIAWYEDALTLVIFSFFNRGKHLWNPISQSFCTKERCFCACWKENCLYFLKLTLFLSHINSEGLQRAFKAKLAKFHWFRETSCRGLKMSPTNLRDIYYQMDHIWWAPSRLKKSLKTIF